MDSICSYGVVTGSIDVTCFLKGIHSFCQCVKSTMFQGCNVFSPTTTTAAANVFMMMISLSPFLSILYKNNLLSVSNLDKLVVLTYSSLQVAKLNSFQKTNWLLCHTFRRSYRPYCKCERLQ